MHSKLWSVAPGVLKLFSAEEMAPWLRVLTALAKHWSLVPSTWLTATCNSRSGGANSLFWLQLPVYEHTHVHIRTNV